MSNKFIFGRIKALVIFFALACLGCSEYKGDRLAILDRAKVRVINVAECEFRQKELQGTVGYLWKGDTVEVLSDGFGKDCKYFEVRLPSGLTGWVTWDVGMALLRPDGSRL